MGFKRNKVKVDLCSYPPYILLAPKKFGKTTFWYRLVKEAWGDDERGLLISFGNEEGYHALDGIQVEVCKDWDYEPDEDEELRGFVQIVDDIVENNDQYKLKGVCLDTLDTMVDVGISEVLRQHKKEKGTPCKTLNEAFSGYGRGKERLKLIMNKQIARLRDAGLAVFILCHIKNKEKTDLISGEKYEVITNNLTDDIYSNFADAAQMVMVGALDREILNGKILSEKRQIFLRGNTSIDAGSRFDYLPEKINLSPKEFLETFEMAVKHQITDGSNIDKMREEEIKKRDKDAERAKEKENILKNMSKTNEKNSSLIEIIKSKYSNATDDMKRQVKIIMSDYGFTSFAEDNLPTVALEKIVEILN